MLKKIIISIIVLFVLGWGSLTGAKAYLKSLLPDKAHFQAIKQAQTSDLSYLNEGTPEYRGKILAVVTSADTMWNGKATGYEHTELARAYWVFSANGFDVDIASPKGGKPPVVLDGDDMGEYDYAFLNDPAIQNKVENSIPLAEINPDEYEAVYYVGGKGTMYDFADNQDIKRITKALYQSNKVVSAVCHGPVALLNVQLDNGKMLLAEKKISAFTNQEELFLIPDAQEVFPFLLEDKLIEQGAQFQAGVDYLEQVSRDGNVITGQNPWSVWTMAEEVVLALGYEPKAREKTPEERSVELLLTYEKLGLAAAKAQITSESHSYQQMLLVMHSFLALMQFELGKGMDILSLAQAVKASQQ
ncbi:hypothetical protein PA25_36230 [Pseudoalteromonas sp. A25]|uniref:type 1 glutamine amidotransferase domain-containing protein n=1 Tax=Pseudoalteromonas sp. A25 TaxID=116092 RepID=UPI0012604D58|nr:type 1 glutamine amidotransferase domain-containing protein [Pseudoalteromonas sp. A25]BBN83638.1 hypothetical protein PA25_36230 [Pseudoalteromonas sp. A25]